MRGILLAAVAALFGCDDANPIEATAPPPPILTASDTKYFIDGTTIPRITCDTGATTYTVGSGVRLDAGLVATADHVVDQANCVVDGERPIFVLRQRKLDFAIVYTMPKELRAKWTCKRPAKGKLFFVSGYPEGPYRHRTMALVSTDQRTKPEGFAVFDGPGVKGTSGGPVTDINGTVYGVITMRLDPAKRGNKEVAQVGVRLFADTALCK